MNLNMHIENRRLFFGAFNAHNDINPNTKKAGILVYNKYVGFFLRLLRIATTIKDGTQTEYVKRKELKAWLVSKGNLDKKTSFETRIKKVLEAVFPNTSKQGNNANPSATQNASQGNATPSNTTNLPHPSQVELNHSTPLPTPLFPLSEAAKEKLKKIVDENMSTISSCLATNEFPVFHNGKHMYVFEHVDFPGLVIKIPNLDNAKEMIVFHADCEKFVKEKALPHCLIPAAELIINGEKAIFVMEKVNGTIDASLAKEVSEIEYEKIDQDPAIRKKWETFFSEAAIFICEKGYWDVGWTNIILTDKGLAFIDFERLNVGSNYEGINRLLKMAPYQCFDLIKGIAQQYGIKKFEETTKESRREELEFNIKLRQFHAKHSIKLNQPLQIKNASECEQIIIKRFDEQLNSTHHVKSLQEQRYLFLYPCCVEGLPVEKLGEFENTLIKLVKKGLVFDWKKDGEQRITSFEIYF